MSARDGSQWPTHRYRARQAQARTLHLKKASARVRRQLAGRKAER